MPCVFFLKARRIPMCHCGAFCQAPSFWPWKRERQFIRSVSMGYGRLIMCIYGLRFSAAGGR